MHHYRFQCLIVLGLLLLAGCQMEKKMTYEQWVDQYKPADVNEAQAMVIVHTAKIEAETQTKLKIQTNSFKLACIAGLALCIGAMVAGQIFGLAIIKQFAVIGSVASGVGWGLLEAEIKYAAGVGIVGLCIGVLICIYAFAIIGISLMRVVKGNELFKRQITDSSVQDTFKKSQSAVQNSSIALPTVQVEKVVSKIRGE